MADLFGQVLDLRVALRLPRDLYRKLFRLNDRQGELFFYMHEQMLARYDAELLSHGLARVEPFGPAQWADPIAAGHDPIELQGFAGASRTIAIEDEHRTTLLGEWSEIETALTSERLRAPGGGTVPIDRDEPRRRGRGDGAPARELAEDAYLGLHGSGHVAIAALAERRRTA